MHSVSQTEFLLVHFKAFINPSVVHAARMNDYGRGVAGLYRCGWMHLAAELSGFFHHPGLHADVKPCCMLRV